MIKSILFCWISSNMALLAAIYLNYLRLEAAGVYDKAELADQAV